ncbi:hypothetical protein [Embleya sp. AB8]|uniref:hypothetical protein n=1 Tax=Embleya sp. AB8 TaxID=3156304 RepID=UPI003C7106C1
MARTSFRPGRDAPVGDAAAGDYAAFNKYLRAVAVARIPAPERTVALPKGLANRAPSLHVGVAVGALDTAGLGAIARLVDEELTTRGGWMSVRRAVQFLAHACRKDSK